MTIPRCRYIALMVTRLSISAVAQWVRAFASQVKGCVFESQPRRTKVLKTGSDSSDAKRSAIGVCHGSSEITIINGYHVSPVLLVWHANEPPLLNNHECRA